MQRSHSAGRDDACHVSDVLRRDGYAAGAVERRGALQQRDGFAHVAASARLQRLQSAGRQAHALSAGDVRQTPQHRLAPQQLEAA